MHIVFVIRPFSAVNFIWSNWQVRLRTMNKYNQTWSSSKKLECCYCLESQTRRGYWVQLPAGFVFLPCLSSDSSSHQPESGWGRQPPCQTAHLRPRHGRLSGRWAHSFTTHLLSPKTSSSSSSTSWEHTNFSFHSPKPPKIPTKKLVPSDHQLPSSSTTWNQPETSP